MIQPTINYAKNLFQQNIPFVVAIVAKTWGSAPCPVGSLLVIDENQHFMGSVSGGCIEGEVISQAMILLSESRITTKKLEFGVSQAMAWEFGLACGGQIEICLIAFKNQQFHHDDWQKFFGNYQATITINPQGELIYTPPISETGYDDKGDFHWIIKPQSEIIIIGAVHVSQFLSVMIESLGWRSKIIDPRQSFGASQRFVNHEIFNQYPDDFFENQPIQAHNAIICLTHDPKIDDMALKYALKSSAFYIGALGSKKNHATRMARMSEYGFSAKEIARIHGPAGLEIHASGACEIAIAIMAQIIKASHEIS